MSVCAYIYLVYIWTTDRLDTEGGCTQPPPDNRLCSQHRFRWASISDLFVPLAEKLFRKHFSSSLISPLSELETPYYFPGSHLRTRSLAPDPLERSTLRSSLYPQLRDAADSAACSVQQQQRNSNWSATACDLSKRSY